MPLSPHSQPSALVMPSTADFEAQYAVYPAGWPSSPRADDIRITLPPWPCLSICRPAARATSQLCVTLASITSRKSSGFWSTIFDTLFCPDATTRMSTRPNFFTVASTIASQFVSELGRLATFSTLPPSFSHSAATFFNSAALLAQSTTLAPAPASTFAASAPKAPVAPVTIAVLPRISNKHSGFFTKSSDMTCALSACSVYLSPLAGRGRRRRRRVRGNLGGRRSWRTPSPRPSQPKSDISDFGRLHIDRTRVNPSSVASGEREFDITAAASRLRPAWSRRRCRD